MIRVIRKDRVPALGDVRKLGRGDAIVISRDATQRRDWPRYQEAIGQAVARGADVHHTAQSGEARV